MANELSLPNRRFLDFRDKLRPGFYDDAIFLREGGAGDQLVLNSFTGADISCYLVMPSPTNKEEFLDAMGLPADYQYPAMKAFAELETISISSARSVFPVRRLGEDHVYKYTRGGRSIAGTMVFTQMNRDVFAEFYRLHSGENFDTDAPFFVDQIPPFHLLFQAQSDYGVTAQAALINVSLVNWGTTLSVHDLKCESTYTYVAQFFFPFVQNYQAFQDIVMKQVLSRREPLSQEFIRGQKFSQSIHDSDDELWRTAQLALMGYDHGRNALTSPADRNFYSGFNAVR